MYIKDERWNMSMSSIDLCSLPNIRSLYLAHCSQEQFNQLINYHQITRLSLPCNYISQDFLERSVLGKGRENRFPQLRSIGRILNGGGSYQTSSFTNNTMIQHVHLVMPSYNSTAYFLQYLPKLHSITVDYLANDVIFSSSCSITAQIRRQHDDGLSNILSKMDFSSQPSDQKKLWFLPIVARIYRLEIDVHGHCDFGKLAHALHQCPILEQVQVRVKYYPKDLDLASIRKLSGFFAAITYGDVQKETGKPVIVAKWSS